MEKKYQIFLSSTYNDLENERSQVIKAILEMGHIPVGMEMFSAADARQWQLITRTINDSDYYIVISAHRYGSQIENISYTEKEYDYAVEQGIPILGFLIDPESEWQADLMDKDPRLVKQLDRFKSKIKARSYSLWRNSEDLYGKCAIALMKEMNINPRIGWIRTSSIASQETIEENLRLRQMLDEKIKELHLLEVSLNKKADSYAKGNEILQLQVEVDILKPSGNYYPEIAEKKRILTVDTTWKRILAGALAAITSFPSEITMKNVIGRLLRDSIDNTKLPDSSHYFGTARPTEECYNTIKIQLLALGYASIVEKEYKDSIKIGWQITASGSNYLNNTLAVKASHTN